MVTSTGEHNSRHNSRGSSTACFGYGATPQTMNRQHTLCLDNTKHFCLFFCFTSSRNEVYCYGRLLEHLESSGTKIMMRGPHICQL